MIGRRAWSIAWARQAEADLEARAVLARGGSPLCEQSHLLQMACEKLCKAFLCSHGSRPEDLQRSHAYVSKTLPVVVRQALFAGPGRRARQHTRFLKHTALLAREIELLAPAVRDGGRRPDNCEYPWADAKGNVISPIDHAFPGLAILRQPLGGRILKILTDIVHRMTGEHGPPTNPGRSGRTQDTK